MQCRKLSLVIPCYNEAHRLPATLERVAAYFGPRGGEVEVVVCDDGSTDKTLEAIPSKLGTGMSVVTLRETRNRGKGHAVMRGVGAATGELILITDADLATPIEEIEKLLPHVGQRVLVIGSRALPGASLACRQPWYRENMGKTFNWLIRLMLGIRMLDTQCGFKLLPASLGRELLDRQLCTGFAFDVEMIVRALKRGIRCTEVPVRWSHCEESKVHILGDSIRMAVDAVRVLAVYGRVR